MFASLKNLNNDRLKQDPTLLALAGLIGLFILLFGYLSLSQHFGLKTQMNDLGNMVQPIYNTSHGRFMHMSNMETVGANPNRLGGHTNYIFLLFVPLYAVFPYPSLLLLFQVFLISSAAIPLFLLGKKLMPKQRWLPLIGSVMYLFNPQVQDITLFDFHALSLAMPLVIWAFYFLVEQKFRWFVIFSSLAVLCKEDVALVFVMLGIYQIFIMKQRKPGLFTTVSSLLFFIVNVFVLMPIWRGSSEWTLISDRYGDLGGSVESVAASSLTNPQILLSKLVETSKLNYLFMLLLSVGGLSLLSIPVLIPTLPYIGINLLSSNEIMHQPFQYYHFAIIIAFLIISSIYTTAQLVKKNPSKTNLISLGVLGWILFYSWLYSPTPHSRVSTFKDFEVTDHHRQISEIQKLIPVNASVSVQNNLGPHFAHRKNIYTFPNFSDQTDYIVLDIKDPYPIIRTTPRQRNFIYITSMSLDEYRQSVETVLSNSNYGVEYYSEDGWLVLKKGADANEKPTVNKMVETQLYSLETRYKDYIFNSYSD